MPLKIILFRPFGRILRDEKCQKMLLVLTCFAFQTRLFYPYLLRFSIKMSFDSFLLEADFSFLIIKEFVFYIRIGIAIDQIWQSVINFELSRCSKLSFSETLHLKFLSSSDKFPNFYQMEYSVILSLTLEY